MPLERQLVLIVQSGVLSLRVCTCVCAHSQMVVEWKWFREL